MAKSSAEYWADRIAAHTWREYNSSEYDREALKRLYKDAYRDIEHDLVKLFKKAEKGEITLTEGHTIRHLAGLKKDIEKIVSNLAQEEEKQLKTALKKHYKAVYEGVYKELPDVSFASVNQRVIEKALSFPWSGADFSDAIWKNKTLLSYTLNTALTRSLVRGTSMGGLAKEINGVMDSGYKNALRLARTETMHYLNDSALKAYKDAGVERVQFWAAEDERTCPECGALHGREFPIGKAPILPIHPNCRCTYIPAVEDVSKYNESAQKREKEERQEDKNASLVLRAKNITELESAVKSITGKTADLSGAGFQVMQKNMAQLVSLCDEYGIHFNSIQTTAARKYLGDVTRTGRYADNVTLNYPKKYYKSRDALLAELRKSAQAGSMPRIGSRNIDIYTTTHEFAHTLSSGVASRLYGVDNDFWDEIEDVYIDYKKRGNGILGKYASSNQDEFLAEAFAEAKLSVRPSEWAKKTLQIVDRYYKKTAKL